MSNSLLTISMITKESLRVLRNNLGLAGSVNRQYDDQFAQTGAKIGSVINIRKPSRFTVSQQVGLQIQDVADQSVALTLGTQNHVGFQFNSKDMTLSIDEFGARYIKPAVNALVNQIDLDGFALHTTVNNSVGTPGTTPATALIALQGLQKLNENACPQDDNLTLCINPQMQASMIDALKGLFQSSEKIASQYEKGRMGQGLGFTWKMDQNVQNHTVGALGGSGTANCATAQVGANIITTGWTANVTGLLKKGDIITFGSVNAVNPVSFQSTGSLKQFVVTADVNSITGGAATIPIFPAIVTSGPYMNVTAGVANSAAITVVGAANVVSPQNLAFHKDAFVLGMADLMLPQGIEMAARASDPVSGLALRVVRAYDIVNDQHPCRMDVLYGWAALYPELACRIQG